MIESMTGFATAQGETEEGTAFQLVLKSVNHRFLDLSLRLPAGCDGLESALRRTLKESVRRGHVELSCSITRTEGTGGRLQVDEALLAAHVGVYRAAAVRYGVAEEPDVNALLRLPGVVRAESVLNGLVGLEAAVVEAMPELLRRFQEARAAEGASLDKELRGAMARCEALRSEIASLRVGARAAYAERLRVRMAELLAGATVPEERVLAEAALLAERSDVDEELVRLQTHLERFVSLLTQGGEVGKRLDFLLQELNREINTLLSKTGGIAAGLRITELGLELKHELERAREQVQNLQ